jgi:hypothetical protein
VEEEEMNQIERGFAAFRKEAGERIAQLETENALMLRALKEIAAWGPHDGCCSYGCESPGIAIAAIESVRKDEA